MWGKMQGRILRAMHCAALPSRSLPTSPIKIKLNVKHNTDSSPAKSCCLRRPRHGLALSPEQTWWP
eukprot:49001-Chlamydomonas_euryale.AAC.1